MQHIKEHLESQGIEVNAIFKATAFNVVGKTMKKAKKGYLVNGEKFICRDTLKTFDISEFACVRKDS